MFKENSTIKTAASIYLKAALHTRTAVEAVERIEGASLPQASPQLFRTSSVAVDKSEIESDQVSHEQKVRFERGLSVNKIDKL